MVLGSRFSVLGWCGFWELGLRNGSRFSVLCSRLVWVLGVGFEKWFSVFSFRLSVGVSIRFGFEGGKGRKSDSVKERKRERVNKMETI
jgi:hypothetical protein